MDHRNLSQKAVRVLDLIAQGHSYEQILNRLSDITYTDFFNAAREALNLDKGDSKTYNDHITDVRKSHPRAYELWTSEEDESLRQMVQAGENTKTIANIFKRQPGAIQSRIRKLGLVAGDGTQGPEYQH